MRFFSAQHTFDADWRTVTCGFWHKYHNAEPIKKANHVKSVDTLRVELDDAAQTLKVRRLMSVNYDMPAWAEKVLGVRMSGIGVEDTEIDLRNRRLFVVGRNLTFGRYFRVYEEASYVPHPSDDSKTLYQSQTKCQVLGFGSLLNGRLEQAATAEGAKKAVVGPTIVESAIQWLGDWKAKAHEWEKHRAVSGAAVTCTLTDELRALARAGAQRLAFCEETPAGERD